MSFAELHPNISVRWFTWREVAAALDHGRTGGIALHYFRYDLRRFGLGPSSPACHILSVDRPLLVKFAAPFGLPETIIQAPRPHRPDIWHFDAFGRVLDRLAQAYPLPDRIQNPAAF